MFCKTVVLALFVVGVLSEYEVTNESKEQIKSFFRTQCKKVNAEDKVEEVTTSTHVFVNCIQELVNTTQLKDEIEQAKPNGALDEVFKKYCAKTSQLKTCIHALFDGVKPCLDDGSKALLPSAKNGTDQLIDFVCYKDGDRIALFIAEHGPECFQAKAEALRICITNIQKSLNSVEKPTALTVPERCAKYDDLSTCAVTALEGCDTPTPSNMAESLFRYVRKSSPCNEALPKN